ncbi:hypothetical protein AVEN_184890-1 [Araneus ventricosus]|uniref:Uncharacterized protein n=1 Tax=Araneus ventricosus TaxID=182803 RepID=A0A4Y2GEH2_ARAVE|nr:hypothetical protein AVEN_184890-1 [Araneus ventricosus]
MTTCLRCSCLTAGEKEEGETVGVDSKRQMVKCLQISNLWPFHPRFPAFSLFPPPLSNDTSNSADEHSPLPMDIIHRTGSSAYLSLQRIKQASFNFAVKKSQQCKPQPSRRHRRRLYSPTSHANWFKCIQLLVEVESKTAFLIVNRQIQDNRNLSGVESTISGRLRSETSWALQRRGRPLSVPTIFLSSSAVEQLGWSRRRGTPLSWTAPTLFWPMR